MARRRSLLRTLRSRRLAVWLLVGLAAWSVLGTGLKGLFGSPLFVVLVGILLASTTLCAWERTRGSWREYRRIGVVSESRLKLLLERPAASIPVGKETALAEAARALRAKRLGVRQDANLVVATGGRWGLFGSPLFHWSLALLIAVVALGQLTRAEGFIGIPEGETRIDEADSYRGLEEGSMYPSHSGLEIGVEDLQVGYVVDGIDRGAAPIVTLARDGQVVAEQRVYPNNPLRYGRLLIHMQAYGFAPVLALQDPDGTEVGRETFLVDFDDSAPGGLTAVDFELVDAEGMADRYWGRLTLSLPEDGGSRGRAVFELHEYDTVVATQEVQAGESIDLPAGGRLVLASVGRYARLSIVDDWSVPFLYSLLALALIGVALATFSPYRKVWAMLVEEGDGGVRLNISAKHWRGSPTFAESIIAAVEAAVGSNKGAEDGS
ncbi:MAG: cytochrome c biogenesis protein ResB [Coriobacteriia bacterium]|nr:cytochrome c biogenesis protein ResB [Coriobacteriia bacterium]